MELQSILNEHEKLKTKLKMLFQTRGDIQAFLDFDDMEILFLIKPPIKKEIMDIARDKLEIGQENEIVFRGKGLFATDEIKRKINIFVEELEKLG